MKFLLYILLAKFGMKKKSAYTRKKLRTASGVKQEFLFLHFQRALAFNQINA
jgi:hypothetical protein